MDKKSSQAVQAVSPPRSSHAGAQLLQRKCACGTNTAGGGECSQCGRKRAALTVSRAVAVGGPRAESPAQAGASVRDVLSSAGHPLDAGTRAYMESRFGRDFSGVPARSPASAGGALGVVAEDSPSEREADDIARRVTRMSAPHAHAPFGQTKAAEHVAEKGSEHVAGRGAGRGVDFSRVRLHTDGRASESALSINARAYTVGDDLVFARGQYNPSTQEGRELLAHELAHVVQSRGGGAASRDGELHAKQFTTDETACTALLTYRVQLLFNDTGADKWDAARKGTFRSGFKNTVESSFNSNSFHIKPDVSSYEEGLIWKDKKSCPCATRGFTPRVEIDLVPDDEWSVTEDWEVEVGANKAGGFMQSSSSTSSATLDEADLTPATKASAAPGATQVPAVHEFGHFMGIQHPGAGLGASQLSAGASEYSHTGTDMYGHAVHGPTDLMGSGSNLRPFYFDNWRAELAEKYGRTCGWKTS